MAMDHQPLYNLADLIRFRLRRGLSFGVDTIAYRYISALEPDSLADFNRQHVDGAPPVDFGLLRRVIDQRSMQRSDLLDGYEGLTIHARLGDCLHKCPSVEDITNLLCRHGLTEDFRQCRIHYGNHNDVNIGESKQYLDRLCEAVEALGLASSVVSSRPDDDFVALANAKTLVAGYRGFAWLAACVNPNRVIWDLQQPPLFPWLGIPANRPQLVHGYHHHLSLRTP